MAARVTNAQVMAALAHVEARLDALAPVPTPAKQAPAEPNGFVTFLRERAAAKVACEIHPASACNRRFSPKSSGRTSHVARVE